MASLIVIPNPILRKRASEVSPTERLWTSHLIDEMSRVRQEGGGIGIAAPQLGESLRIINIVFRGREYTIFNPIIKHKRGAVKILEGCLSVPDIYRVTRPMSLTLTGEDMHGNPVKLKCRDVSECAVAEHEVNHLDGILIDKIGEYFSPKFSNAKDKLAFGEKNEKIT